MLHSECKNGIRKHSHWNQILKAPLFPSDVHHHCVQLLRNFGISFPGEPDQEIIPSLLQLKKPDIQLIWLRADTSRIQYERVWQFTFLPSNLFSHLLASKFIFIV